FVGVGWRALRGSVKSRAGTAVGWHAGTPPARMRSSAPRAPAAVTWGGAAVPARGVGCWFCGGKRAWRCLLRRRLPSHAVGVASGGDFVGDGLGAAPSVEVTGAR